MKFRPLLFLCALLGTTLVATATLSQPGALGNDFSSGPYTIAQTAQTGSNVGATADVGGESSVWFKWQAPQNGTVAVNTNGSAFDTYLRLYTADLATIVGGDDDSGIMGGASNVPGADSHGADAPGLISVSQGDWYYIAVSGVGGATGDYKLQVLFTPTGGSAPSPGCTGTGLLSILTPADGADLLTTDELAISGKAQSEDCSASTDLQVRLSRKVDGATQVWIAGSEQWVGQDVAFASTAWNAVTPQTGGAWQAAFDMPNGGNLDAGDYSIDAQANAGTKYDSVAFTVTPDPTVTGTPTPSPTSTPSPTPDPNGASPIDDGGFAADGGETLGGGTTSNMVGETGAQPDLGVRNRSGDPNAPYVGATVTNAAGTGQVVSKTVGVGGKAIYDIALWNRGPISDTFTVSGAVSGGNVEVHYYDSLVAGANEITTAVANGTYGVTLAANAAKNLRVEVTALSTATAGMMREVVMSATSPSDGTLVDVIKMQTTAQSVQPDVSVRNGASGTYVGVSSYQSEAATTQLVSQSISAGGKALYQIAISNTSTLNASFKIKGLAGNTDNTDLKVEYFDALTGTTIITSQLVANTYTITLAPGETRDIRAEVTPLSGIAPGDTHPVKVTAVSTISTAHTDSAAMQTTYEGAKPDLGVRNRSGDPNAAYITPITTQNAANTNQIVTRTVGVGTKAIYEIALWNRGPVSDTFTVTGTVNGGDVDVQYFDSLVAGASNITTPVVNGTYGVPLAAGGARNLRVEVTGLSSAPSGAMREVLLTAVSTTDSAKVDAVKMQTTVQSKLEFSAGDATSVVEGNILTWTVTRNTPTTSALTVALQSSATSAATVPATVTIAAGQASATFTVTGVDDAVADGTQTSNITAAVTGHTSATKTVSVTDNDNAGVTVTPTSGLTTTEAAGAGHTATFTVKLDSQPTANVSIALSSSDTGEGIVAPATLTFTSANWASPQTVTVTGVADTEADGNQAYSILLAGASSTDSVYSALNAAAISDVAVTSLDSNVATLSLTLGATVVEGGTLTGTVTRNTPKTAPLTVNLSSNNSAAATVPATVTIPADDNDITFTLSATDDAIADGTQSAAITASATGLAAATANVNVTDNDEVGITVTPTTGLTTTEAEGAGHTATFTVRLNSEPRHNVSIGLSSDKPLEGTVDPAALVFSASNWNTPQTVTITGVADNDNADGDQTYLIVTAPAVSTYSLYSGKNASDVSVTSVDDDVATLTLAIAETVTEGGTLTGTVTRNTPTTASLNVALTSSNPATATLPALVSIPAGATFTEFTLNAADGSVADGTHNVVVSADAAGYLGGTAMVSVTDNDSVGILVAPTTGLTTTEAAGAGHTATFTVKLMSEPTANVSITLSSSEIKEGTVSPANLTFTSANWNSAQTVTVTGVADGVVDDNQTYRIVATAVTSDDTAYNALPVDDVTVISIDSDVASLTLLPVAPITEGETALVTVKRNTSTAAPLSVSLASSDVTAATVPDTVTIPIGEDRATFVVTAVDDAVADGAQSATLTASVLGYLADTANVQVLDNDEAGITVTPTSGLTTTEAAGAGHTATFTVKLTSEPTADVSIGLSSSNPAEGMVAPSTLTFTSANWNTAQTVTVTGVADDKVDSNKTYSIVTAAAVSADALYNNKDASDIGVTSLDSDVATLSLFFAAGPLSEGGTLEGTVGRNTVTAEPMTVTLGSSDLTAATVPATVTIPAGESSVNFTLSGVDDAVADGAQTATISAEAAGMPTVTANVTVLDNDSAGVLVNPLTLTTTEAAGTGHDATFNLKLTSQPLSNVVIALTSSDVLEGTVSAATVTFTPANWNVLQTVTVTGVADDFVDGDKTYSIVTAATSDDAAYDGLPVADVTVTSKDSDTAKLTVSLGATLAEGDTLTGTVERNTSTAQELVVTLTSSNSAKATVSPQVTIAAGEKQATFLFTAVDDAVARGTQNVTVTASNPAYLPGIDSVEVSDDDARGVTVAPKTGLETAGAPGAGHTATFTIRLASQPTADVTIPLSSSKPGKGTVAPATVTFAPVDWNVEQTVTVTGVADAIVDADQSYTVVTAAATSGDANYNGFDADDVSVTSTDVAALKLAFAANSVVEGGTLIGTVRRNTPTNAALIVTLTSEDTTLATVPAMVTIPAGQREANFNLTATDDEVTDGAQNVTITANATDLAEATDTVSVTDNESGAIDALIKQQGDATYLGRGVQNTTGADQTATQNAAGDQTKSYELQAINRQITPQTLTIKATESTGGGAWSIGYFVGQTDITSAITSAAGWTTTAAVVGGAGVDVRVDVKPGLTVEAATLKNVQITATSGSDTNGDTVIAQTSKTGPALLAAPMNLTATAGNAQVNLVWDAVPGADSYKLYRSPSSNGPWTVIQTQAQTTFLNSGLTNGVIYYYRVAGANGVGDGLTSSIVNAMPWAEYIERLEYNLGDGWQAAPVTGGNGYDITVKDHQTVGLRAVLNTQVAAEWPLDNPVWQTPGAFVTSLEGAEVWFAYEDEIATTHTVTGECVNNKSIAIRVLPDDD